MKVIKNLIIIGSGPAGLTAAIYASRANLKPLLIEGTTPGGQLMGTSYVENWPGTESILGPDLMISMQKHAKDLGTEFVSSSVTKVDFTTNPFSVWTDDRTQFHAKSIIIASGATPNRLKCPGENEYWGKGITTCAVCDAPFYRDKKALIIGGGDTAMEDAYFLRKFTDKITIVQHLDALTASYAMQQRVIHDPSINILYNTTVQSFLGDNGQLTHAELLNKKTNKTTSLEIDGAFVAIGLTPNTAIFKGQLELDKWGYLVTKNNIYSSVPGIFAAGDVQDFVYRQAIVAAGYGCQAALAAQRYLEE